MALKLSLSNALREYDIPLALKETDILYNLDRGFRPNYVSVLNNISLIDEGKIVIDAKLEDAPDWGYAFLVERLKRMDATNYAPLKSSIDAYLLNIDKPVLKKKIISNYSKRLVKLGQSKTALAFWKEHVDFTANYTEQKFAVFNPAFQELDAPEPFNWNLLNNSDVTTEYNKPESLFARFKGSRTRVIAQQYIAWKPTPSVKLVLDFVHKYDKNNGKFHIDIALSLIHI